MADSDPAPVSGASRRRQGLWLTVGEVVGVLAVIVAGLNYWDNHRVHRDEVRREQARAQAAAAFVAAGEADADGTVIPLRPLAAGQAIQSQRYRFPGEVLDHPVEVAAARPRIELSWIGGGLRRALEAAHVRATGEARLPVVIETIFVEDGETRSDVSLYDVGFSFRREFLAGRQVRLTGVSLAQRGLTGDPGPRLERRWAGQKGALAPPAAPSSPAAPPPQGR